MSYKGRLIVMKKLEICFDTLDCDNKTVKQYEWSPLYDEIVNTFSSILGSPVDITIQKYTETNKFLGEFDMKSKTLTYNVNWNEELIIKNILKLGDNRDWNLNYSWVD